MIYPSWHEPKITTPHWAHLCVCKNPICRDLTHLVYYMCEDKNSVHVRYPGRCEPKTDVKRHTNNLRNNLHEVLRANEIEAIPSLETYVHVSIIHYHPVLQQAIAESKRTNSNIEKWRVSREVLRNANVADGYLYQCSDRTNEYYLLPDNMKDFDKMKKQVDNWLVTPSVALRSIDSLQDKVEKLGVDQETCNVSVSCC